MPDLIVIEALELSARVGVPEEERAVPQRLTAHVRLEPTRGFQNLEDDLSKTVDYFEAARVIQAEAGARPRRLIETLAEDLAEMLLDRFAIRVVELELRKYILRDTAFVAVRLRRERER